MIDDNDRLLLMVDSNVSILLLHKVATKKKDNSLEFMRDQAKLHSMIN